MPGFVEPCSSIAVRIQVMNALRFRLKPFYRYSIPIDASCTAGNAVKYLYREKSRQVPTRHLPALVSYLAASCASQNATCGKDDT